jgi:hypothetical protein
MESVPQHLRYDRSTLFQNCFPDHHLYCSQASTVLQSDSGSHKRLQDSLCGDDLGNPSIRFQRHLEQESDIALLSKLTSHQRVEYVFKFITWTPAFVPNVVANGIFDWNLNLNPLRKYYQNGLERTYGLVPLSCPPKANYLNSRRFLFSEARAKDISFNDLSLRITERNERCKDGTICAPLPFWIINATAAVDSFGMLTEPDYRLTERVFEFTPLWFGSDHFGYWSHDSARSRVSVSKAVSLSGAAVDGQARKGRAIKLGARLLNINIGAYIRNPGVHTGSRVLHNVLPVPTYLAHRYRSGNKKKSIYLSDGGHSENLGVFSLIRRGVKVIIVVDAEEDADSCFGAWRDLQHALYREMGITLEMDRQGFDVQEAESSILLGNAKLGDHVVSRIVYLKLSLEPKRLEQPCATKDGYPCTVKLFAALNKRLFPHHPTTDIQYSEDQYRAYRDLGYSTARRVTIPK